MYKTFDCHSRHNQKNLSDMVDPVVKMLNVLPKNVKYHRILTNVMLMSNIKYRFLPLILCKIYSDLTILDRMRVV